MYWDWKRRIFKTSICWLLPSNKFVYYHAKKWHFAPSLWMVISEMQKFILKVDPPWKMVGLAVDIWGNKMKVRDLWEAWEVCQFRLSNMTTKIVFVPPLTYQTSRNLFNLTVKYCTIGPYLQSRRHQRRSLPFPGKVHKARKGQWSEIATRNEFGRTTKAQRD